MSPEAGVDEAGTSHDAPFGWRGRLFSRRKFGRDALLFVGLFLLLNAVYLPALAGFFVSDDFEVLVNNPYVNALSVENLLSVFDPNSAEKSFTGNYAPIDEILMAIERHFFGDQVFYYHLVNLLFHAVNAVLLIAWLRRAGVPETAALLGGLCFALHPANVEAVAWMSQLKTVASLSLSLAALLAFRSAPRVSALLFGAALLTKASALFALPTVAAWAWVHPESGRWRWVGVWALLSGLYAIPEFASFQSFGAAATPGYADIFEQLRSMAAFSSRYALMAATSYGLSAFHEPAPARSVLDPWWLAALPLLGALAWRATAVLRSRREEAVFWVAAAAGYAPISQIFPFLYPMGDRYLYFVLPGLIGAFSLLGADLLARFEAAGPAGRTSAGAVSRGAVVVAIVLVIFLGLRSNQRAAVWRNETHLFLDAERHYPNGGPASLLQARRAAQVGDADAAVAALARAEAAGLGNFMVLPSDPALAPITGSSAFREFVRGMAGRWIERSRNWPTMNQAQYHLLAHAHMLRNELPQARSALDSALAAGGPQETELRAELNQLGAGPPP
jgi:hypothetical protein